MSAFGVSNHQPHDCLLNRLFKAQIKENIKAPRHWPSWGEFTGHRWIPLTMASDAEHKGPVLRKMFPFDDVIMNDPFFDFRAISTIQRPAFYQYINFCGPVSRKVAVALFFEILL